MNATTLERFRLKLLAKRHNLTDWLSATPASKKQIRLGSAGENGAQAHVQVLDKAIARTAEGTLGSCMVCHDPVEPGLLEMDYTCCVCLDHLSPKEKERLEFELSHATKVQQALLPQQVLDIPNLEIAAISRPATVVGGDYFDFYRFQDGGYGLLIADVAGHGLAASLIMASLQASLRILVPEQRDPAAVLARLNELFGHNIHMTSFVSVFLAHFDPATLALTYSSAGHNPPLLYHPQRSSRQKIEWLGPTGAAIGLVEEAVYRTERVQLAPADTLVLYTDGVTEAADPRGEEFGTGRLAAEVEANHEMALPGLLRRIRAQLGTFTQDQPLADDTTLVAARVG